MAYTLRQAAEAVGKGKPAILKAIQSGKISGVKDSHGEWQIEPAELHRVYPPVSETASETGSKELQATIGNTNENSLLRQEIQFLREKLADLEHAKDAEQRHLSERIEELRRDRDDLRSERNKLLGVIEEQAGSVKLLTDQRAKGLEPQEEPAQEPPRKAAQGLWGRVRYLTTGRH
jgi:hypothetical protein